MAEWKKVVVSGSAISQLQNDSNYLVSGDSGVELTGSFKGDGSQITGVTADVLGNSLTDGNGITDFTFDGSGAASVAVQADGSTLAVGVAGVKVADAGITATQLAASVAGNGLAGGAGTALSVNTDGTSITTSGDSLTLAGTAFSSSVDSRIDAAQSQATANSSSIANLGSGFATDSELSALSSSAALANSAIASNVSANSASIAALDGNFATDSDLSALSSSAAVVAAANASAIAGLDSTYATDVALNTISGSAHTQRVAIESSLDGKINTEKGRIDAILTASVADTDTFAEIVSLINSVDTTNDTAFAGFVTSSNARATSIEGSVTALSGSVLSVTDAIASDVAANTAKVGITIQQASDITANNAKISYNSAASTKLGTIEENADVTDATNVEAAGALMDTEVANLAQVKAFSSSDYLASSTTTISVAQAQAIVDNTAKVGITAAQATAITNNSASIAALDSTYATDTVVTALSSSVDSRLDSLEGAGTTAALSASAHTARGVVASDASTATSTLSGSVLVVTNALDTRVDTLEGVSHTHSNKANLDQINQDLGTSDDVTFNDLVVDGNLTVSGTTTTVNTANLLVEDKFILLNSGSADPDEGGIIIDEGAGSGHAFIYDKGDTRWGFNASVAQDASTANATAHAAAVVDMQNVAHADSAEYQKNGNIKVDAGSIFIYC